MSETMNIYDFKKEQKMYYTMKTDPHYIEIPAMKFIMIKGTGNPNTEDGEYQKAIEMLYALSYAIRMSYKTGYAIPGYYPYVVPPLESLWTMQNKEDRFAVSKKDELSWIAMLHQPDFVDEDVVAWACEYVYKKKKIDASDKVSFQEFCEGRCIQMLHKGSYDEEPASFLRMEAMLQKDGYTPTLLFDEYHHHEIYIKDNRDPDHRKWKTVLRQCIAE